ncbi:hypothetical protein LWI28_013712 [Acer negundo]|uniref:Uncharacterized protein n=1 Tax=Acer negundo TaxID=4023 RepID=A0AAD5JQ74_ACENE|nr:hypothetical protein LWI28_013712 [Acer negundo]
MSYLPHAQVATIFANGEHEIGELIPRAMERVGKEGIIIVSEESTLDNELEVVEGKGMKLARGYISPYFITDKKTQKCRQEKREVLVVAEDVGSHALNLLFIRRNFGVSKQVCAIKAPGFGENRRANLEDLAILTGGELELLFLEVGGASKAEVGERKDMVEYALNATRAAVEEGIVPGGGVAHLYATKALENFQTQNNDQGRGIQAPTLAIASNAGFDGSLVINKLLEQDDCNLGIDAAKGEFVDMMKTGIIEPVKVLRTALVEASRSRLLSGQTPAVEGTETLQTNANLIKGQGRKKDTAQKIHGMRTRLSKNLEEQTQEQNEVDINVVDVEVNSREIHEEVKVKVVDVNGNNLSWCLEKEIEKVIETGMALGFDFRRNKKEVSAEIHRKELEDIAQISGSNNC